MGSKIVLVVMALLLSGCEREATPEAAVETAVQTKGRAEGLQKESQERTAEAERTLEGK